ncbi:histidine kinase [Nibrella saemangeumensis]|uniref:Histidine kinase n=1 Tax=Nibrella saemangeumensis TaxID=1084526 RepID=A0ABP8N343_9BACT
MRLLRQLFTLPDLNLSPQSKWIIIGLFSWGIPLFNYFWLGPRYYQDWRVLLVATLLGFAICLPFLGLQTAAVRLIGNRFPNFEQTFIRVGLELMVTAFVALAVEQAVRYTYMAVFDGFSISRDKMLTILAMGLITNFVSVGLYECYYTLNKWKEKSLQAEAFRRESLLNQLEVLKNQVNPHFLFNSLNSLSCLISESPRQAEQFVDELSKVYRYLLQTNEGELATLEQELGFIEAYYYLLKTRYNEGIHLHVDVAPDCRTHLLPPLTLQLLVENAVKHNSVQASSPLQIGIHTTANGYLRVRNNLQRKNSRVLSNGVGLNNITAKYRILSLSNPALSEPMIAEDGGEFTVTLPLLSAANPRIQAVAKSLDPL